MCSGISRNLCGGSFVGYFKVRLAAIISKFALEGQALFPAFIALMAFIISA